MSDAQDRISTLSTRPPHRSARWGAAFLLSGASLLTLPRAFPAQAAPLRGQGQSVNGAVNGPLLVLDQQGRPDQGDLTGAAILSVQDGRVSRVLARGLTVPFPLGLAPSPRGRYVAFSQDVTAAPGAPQQTNGLWLTTNAGRSTHRVLLPPASPNRNTLAIGAIAWSPDRYTLAYAVNLTGDAPVLAQPERNIGLWLTPYDAPHPRLTVTSAQLGALAGPLGACGTPWQITRLSWAQEGRMLAVSVLCLAPSGRTPSKALNKVILSVDVVTGQIRRLVTNAQDAALAPRAALLAYVSGDIKGSALWLADAQGQHAYKLVTLHGALSSPAWSPDGHTIAYIEGPLFTGGGPTTIHTVDVATGRTQGVLVSNASGQTLLPAGGQFIRLAWMHAYV